MYWYCVALFQIETVSPSLDERVSQDVAFRSVGRGQQTKTSAAVLSYDKFYCVIRPCSAV